MVKQHRNRFRNNRHKNKSYHHHHHHHQNHRHKFHKNKSYHHQSHSQQSHLSQHRHYNHSNYHNFSPQTEVLTEEEKRQEALKKRQADALKVLQQEALRKHLAKVEEEEEKNTKTIKKKKEKFPNDGFGNGSCEALLRAAKRNRRERFDSHDSAFDSSIFRKVNKYCPPKKKKEDNTPSSSITSSSYTSNTNQLHVIKNTWKQAVYGPLPPPSLSNTKLALSKTKLAPSNTKPALSNTKPALSNTKPALSNTKPALSNTKPALSNTKPALQTSLPRQEKTGSFNSIKITHARSGIKTSFAESSSDDDNDDQELSTPQKLFGKRHLSIMNRPKPSASLSTAPLTTSLKKTTVPALTTAPLSPPVLAVPPIIVQPTTMPTTQTGPLSTPPLLPSTIMTIPLAKIAPPTTAVPLSVSVKKTPTKKRKADHFAGIVASLDAAYASMSPLKEKTDKNSPPAVINKPTEKLKPQVSLSNQSNKEISPKNTSLSSSRSSSSSKNDKNDKIDTDEHSDDDNKHDDGDIQDEYSGELNGDDQDGPTVEGFMHNDTLYLRDIKTNTIYSSTRDSDGDLVCIGRWDSNTSTIVASRRVEHSAGVAAPIYPFSVHPDDHCETPRIAYEHIVPILSTVANATSNINSKYDLKIWDPFFCAGGVANHLNSLGFKNVYNENEDFYAYDNGKTSGPKEYDVLVTNPPYTAEHIPSLLKFCKNAGKPCLLLLPNYCLHKYKKHIDAMIFKDNNCKVTSTNDMFYVWSKQRYKYKSPKFARSKDKARKDRVTSPFVSFWYCYVPSTWKEHCSMTNSMNTSLFQRDFLTHVQKSKLIIPSELLKDPTKVGTDEENVARNMLKGRFAESAGKLPVVLLDHSELNSAKSGGRGGSGGGGGGGGGKKKRGGQQQQKSRKKHKMKHKH
jgi:hypothetical protein